MATRKVETETIIQATPQKIWKVLTEFERYPEWNPFIKSIVGGQKVGKKLATQIIPPNRSLMKFSPTILAYEPEKELRWLGSGAIKGLFDGEHYFKLHPLEDGSVRFEHGENFSGILVGLMPKLLDDTKLGFEQMNVAFKKECES